MLVGMQRRKEGSKDITKEWKNKMAKLREKGREGKQKEGMKKGQMLHKKKTRKERKKNETWCTVARTNVVTWHCFFVAV